MPVPSPHENRWLLGADDSNIAGFLSGSAMNSVLVEYDQSFLMLAMHAAFCILSSKPKSPQGRESVSRPW